MLTAISILGWLLLVAALGIFIWKLTTKGEVEKPVLDWQGRPQEDNKGNVLTENVSDRPEWLNDIKSSYISGGVIIAVFMILIQGLFFYARPGHQYYLVYPTGGETTVFTQGFKWKGFARIQEWEKFVDVKNVASKESVEGIGGVIKGGIPIRFIDQVRASVYLSARFQMPEDPETFMQLAKEFRHPKNLVNNTLIPTVKEQVINTGYMFAAQNYISGAASDFRQTLDEQLKNGGYSVERKEEHDTIWSNIKIEGDRQIKEIKTTYKVTKREKAGLPIRIPHDIVKNGIITSQVIVDQVMLEKAFKKRLEKQRDISAQKRVEMETIETLKAQQKRIAAEGEKNKTKEKAEQEVKMVQKLIKIETQLKEEETNKKLAAIQLETEKLRAQAVKVKADAEAEKNRKLVYAGLTPQERMQMEIKIADVVSKNLAGPNGINFPQTYIGGASGANGQQSSDPLQQIMSLMLLNMQSKGK